MDIAVLGAGSVGGGIGRAWARVGHRVTFGVPDPASPKARAAQGGTGAALATVAEAVAGAGTLLLATPWPAAESALRMAGDLAGKTVIDATNPLTADFSWLEEGYAISGAERVAGWAPGAAVFKAFNQTGAENLADPSRYATRPAMFVCGDDTGRKPDVLGLVADVGFEAVDAGPLRAARLLEPYAMLWITLAHAQGLGRDLAFTLQRPARP